MKTKLAFLAKMFADTRDELHYVCGRNILHFDPSIKPPTEPQTSFIYTDTLTDVLDKCDCTYRKQRLNTPLLQIFSLLRKGEKCFKHGVEDKEGTTTEKYPEA